GPMAVSVFFLLSGFVLAYTYAQEAKLDARSFLFARFARIYPVYLLGLLIITVDAYLSGQVSSLQNWLLQAALLHDWTTARFDWNDPSWSLSAEAFFYAVFPFLIGKLKLLGPRALRWTIILSLGLRIGLALAYLYVAPDGELDFNDHDRPWF